MAPCLLPQYIWVLSAMESQQANAAYEYMAMCLTCSFGRIGLFPCCSLRGRLLTWRDTLIMQRPSLAGLQGF